MLYFILLYNKQKNYINKATLKILTKRRKLFKPMKLKPKSSYFKIKFNFFQAKKITQNCKRRESKTQNEGKRIHKSCKNLKCKTEIQSN